ncbi:MAG: hypothetical protein U9R43_16590 [Thermodesulfobacteriota bacterium]|nr:hypothetical protein [Thermodesulfobacteriota bacterium]
MEIIKGKFKLYTLNISNFWDPVDDKNFWEATAEVPDICSLFDVHLFIQNIINFDNDHLFEFYAGRNDRNRKIKFSGDSGSPYDGGDYESILLKDIYPLKGLKLYYLFDFGDNWLFEIRKSRKKAKPLQDTEYPRIVSDNGVKLRQYTDYDLEE